MAAVALACGGDEVSTSTPAPSARGVSQRYVGCIGPTATSNVFILSVLEGRDFTTGEPPGTPIPRKSQLPEDAPPPIPPVTVTSGTPGGGPTPTTKVVTYTLSSDGGKNLNDYVGHTVEVLGIPEPERDDRSAATSSPLPEPLHVTSLRDLADHCK